MSQLRFQVQSPKVAAWVPAAGGQPPSCLLTKCRGAAHGDPSLREMIPAAIMAFNLFWAFFFLVLNRGLAQLRTGLVLSVTMWCSTPRVGANLE